MSLSCTRCDGSGFLNLEQILDLSEKQGDITTYVLDWIASHTDHDVQVCDCCGDGEGWYGIAGEHYNSEDPPGRNGPYEYNGGLCKCH